LRNAFNAYSSEVMRNGTPLCAWKRQLELCIAMCNQILLHGTDIEGNKITEEQQKDVEAILSRCILHLDIANKEGQS